MQKMLVELQRMLNQIRSRLASFDGHSNKSRIGAWRSLVAHLVWDQRVASSNLAAPTIS